VQTGIRATDDGDRRFDMKRKRNGLIRLENVLMASIAVVASAVCAAPFFGTTESWGVAREQFVRTAPVVEQEATLPAPLLPRSYDVPLEAQVGPIDPEPMLNRTPCTCVSPREQAMERLRDLRTCGQDATPSRS
jgi:hypothetical protein